MINVVHLVTLVDEKNSYGGPLTVALNHCNELRRRGYDAQIAGGWRGVGRPPEQLESVPVHLFRVFNLAPTLRFSGLVSPGLLRWLWLKRRTTDIVHIHLARDLVPLSAAALLWMLRIPYVTQTHGMVVPSKRLLARFIDVISVRPVLKRSLVRFVLTAEERSALDSLCSMRLSLTLLANGVQPQPPRRSTPDSEDLNVLFMSRLHPRKRVLDFARAAQILSLERGDVTFSVVGPDDGDLRRLKEFLAAHPSLVPRLKYEGTLTHREAVERLASAHLYVLPSVDEPFPMSLLEALSVGVPSVCTDSCGLAVPLKRMGAIAVTKPDAEDLAAKIRALLNDSKGYSHQRRRGLQAIQEHYSIKSVIDRWIASCSHIPEHHEQSTKDIRE